MSHSVRPMSPDDRYPIMDIFNHYVENSFAAYPEIRLPYQAYDMFLQMSEGYPRGTVVDQDGRIVGFGMLRTYHPMPVFSKTSEITYFLDPGHTGKGLGKELLDYLERGGREMGLTTILASISTLNPGSIAFHRKNGFSECGRFLGVGVKKGHVFDVVWMQKIL